MTAFVISLALLSGVLAALIGALYWWLGNSRGFDDDIVGRLRSPLMLSVGVCAVAAVLSAATTLV